MQEVHSIQNALDILELPPFITKDDIKIRYIYLAKRFHPDINGDSDKMEQINWAYNLLLEYIDSFRYSFDEDELNKQLPNLNHNNKFRF